MEVTLCIFCITHRRGFSMVIALCICITLRGHCHRLATNCNRLNSSMKAKFR
jgi:hypothetical protein